MPETDKNRLAAHTLKDFDYALPTELIAQHPSEQRTGSRLLHVDAQSKLTDRRFVDIASLVKPNDLLIFNDTRVIKARLYGQKDSGGKIELMIDRVVNRYQALAQIRASKAPKPGGQLFVGDDCQVTVTGRKNDLYELTFEQPVFDVLDGHGHVPLPPYIEHPDEAADAHRYQTVYAKYPGAVAAPTAGLHFDEIFLQALRDLGVKQAFVTLHVGAGTFQPVRENDLSKHHMHSEWYSVPTETVAAIKAAKAAGGRVIAVGTTSVRALESCCQDPDGQPAAITSDTELFITPGYQWHVIDAMVTNFHLPQSTLLMLVAAFIGMTPLKMAYEHAVRERYRFFSYGDAMFLEKRPVDAI